MCYSALLPCLLAPKLAEKWTTPCPSLTLALPTFLLELWPLVGYWWTAKWPTLQASPPWQPFIFPLRPSVLIRSSSSKHIKAVGVFWASLYSSSTSTSVWHVGHPSPRGGQWPTVDYPHACLFPKLHFFNHVAGSPLLVFKLVPIGREQEEAEERGRPLQICRWQF